MFARVLQIVLTTVLTALSVGCATNPKPKPVPPTPPPAANEFCIAPHVKDARTGAPVPGAKVFISTLTGTTNQDGYIYLQPVPFPNVLDVYADGYQDCTAGPDCGPVNIRSWSCDVEVRLQPKRGPRPSLADVYNIRGNFLSIYDSLNRLMLSWFYPNLGDSDRALWRQAYANAGVKHVVLDPAPCYPGYWVGCSDLRGTPDQLTRSATELLDNNFIPLVMLTTGDAGTQTDPDAFWPGYRDSFQRLEPCLIGNNADGSPGTPCAVLALGFETGGPCSAWSSAQISHAITVGHQLMPNAVWAWEGCPERFSGVSNPPQADDPWQSNEPAFWTSNGGQYFQIMLYETPHGPKLLDPAGATGQFCHLDSPCGGWEDRWLEGLQGHGFGRRVPISFFEVTGSDYKGGGVSDDTVLRINNRALRLCNLAGVTCTFGNGLPSGPQ